MDPIVDPEQMDLEDALMRAGRDVRMSPELRNKTLTALGVGVAVGMTTTSVAQAGMLGWLSGKTGTVVVATGFVGALGIAGAVALSGGPSSPDETSSAQVSVVERVSDEAPQERTPERPDETPEPQTDVVPAEVAPPPPAPRGGEREASAALEGSERPRAPGGTPPPSPASEPLGLREELSHISRVEAALQGANPARALTLLSEYRQRFPRPQLGLEAEVLTIQALSESGSSAAARRRAASFVEKFPTSPLAARAKRYLD